MSRSVSKSIKNQLKYFSSPLMEGQYPVVLPPMVPKHILRPSYVDNTNPIFGKYDGSPKIHSSEEINKMKKVARIASCTLEATKQYILEKAESKQPLTEEDIDRFVYNYIVASNAYPTPIGFMHFPKSVCLSVNQCIVHGIPSTRPLQLGDKINIDVTAYFDGHHGDNNLTVFFGKPTHQHLQHIVEVTQNALYEAITVCGPGVPFNKIGLTIEKYAQKHKVHVCDHFSGHGIGQFLHMSPLVAHVYYKQFTQTMKVGNTFTIEPILTLFPLTQSNIHVWNDNFTCISPNNPNAQFQHTILIVEDGCQIITRRKSQTNIPNPNRNIRNLDIL